MADFGSLDINGCNRGLFFDCDYLGIDIGPGNNVDIVSPAHLLNLTNGSFDVVVSTECLEHDKYWQLTLKKAYEILKPGGLFFFSCATTGRSEHGTHKCEPGSSPFTQDYYMNLTEADVRRAYKDHFGQEMEQLFQLCFFETPNHSADLYFRGIKR